MDFEHERRITEIEARSKSNQRRIESLEKQVEEHHALGAPIKLEALTEKVGVLEKNISEIHTLSRSVSKLADNMERMLEEQRKQREDIDALKNEPAERWSSMKRTAFTTIVSVIAGALAVGLVGIIANFMK